MSSTPDAAHLDNHHRDTLDKIFEHPTSHNIEWRAVVSLLEAVGSVVQRHDGKFSVTVGTENVTIEPPRAKDIDTEEVVLLRRMLGNAGYGPGRP